MKQLSPLPRRDSKRGPLVGGGGEEGYYSDGSSPSVATTQEEKVGKKGKGNKKKGRESAQRGLEPLRPATPPSLTSGGSGGKSATGTQPVVPCPEKREGLWLARARWRKNKKPPATSAPVVPGLGSWWPLKKEELPVGGVRPCLNPATEGGRKEETSGNLQLQRAGRGGRRTRRRSC